MAHILVKNLYASAFGQVVNVISQVSLLPLYLISWDVRLYGEWIVLLALPTYFSTLADIGLTQVSANDMTIKFAQGHRDKSLEIFQSAWLFVSMLSSLVVGVIAVAIMALGIVPMLGLSIMSAEEATCVLLCALGMFFIGFQHGIVQAALRAVGRFAEGNLASYAITLLEVLTVAAALFLGAAPVTIAILMLATRLAGLVTGILILRYFAPWFRHGIAEASSAEIRRLFVPSIAILGIPAGNAAMMEGLIVILNFTVGPASVVLFSTTRTMTRLLLQVIGMFSRSAWPEISRLYGTGRTDRLGAFLTHGTQLAALLAIGYAVVTIAGAPLIFKLWTAGRVQLNSMLLTVLMLAVVISTFRAFPDTLIFATNRHLGYSGYYLLVCLTAAAASYPMSRSFGLIGAAGLVAAVEIVLLAISMARALRQVGEGLAPLQRLFTTLPPLRLLFAKSASKIDI